MTNDPNGNELFRYEDILRAIGRYIDTHDVQDVVLLQSDDGILLRGFMMVKDRGGFSSRRLIQHQFTQEDLNTIDEEARKRRGKGSRLFR